MKTIVALNELSNEELIKLAKNGDSEAYEYFFDKNYRLSYFTANKWRSTKLEIEDIISLCNIGLVKAYNTFENSKDIKFSTYAVKIMNNEILMELRKYKSKRRLDVSIETVLTNDGTDLKLIETLPAEEEDFTVDSIMDYNSAVELFLEKASEKEKLAFDLFKKGYSQKEMENMLGFSQSYISRIMSKVEKNIKEIIEFGEIRSLYASNLNSNTRPKVINVEQLVYVMINYPDLGPTDISHIFGVKSASTISKHKRKFKDGLYKDKKPDSSIKPKVDGYLKAQGTFKNY